MTAISINLFIALKFMFIFIYFQGQIAKKVLIFFRLIPTMILSPLNLPVSINFMDTLINLYKNRPIISNKLLRHLVKMTQN